MADDVKLLTDEEMRRFIAQGYLTLKTGHDRAFHDRIYSQIGSIFERGGNPGNNILPLLPDLSQVFDDPRIRGALQSVLGPRYFMHPHRHCHHNRGSNKAQTWHKDSYWGYMKPRHHRPWWAMCFYYPQDVTTENGPSSVVPGGQFTEDRPIGNEDPGQLVLGEAGTVTMIHYDLWHRAAANRTRQSRYMLKFQFVRTQDPESPTWSSADSAWVSPEGTEELPSGEAVWEHVWHWLRGDGRIVGRASEDVGALAAALDDPSEKMRLHASYSLAAAGEDAVETLAAVLDSGSERAVRHAGYALVGVGESGVPVLVEGLSHASEHVRMHAAAALGEMASGAGQAVPQLAAAVNDSADKVRRTVAESLGMIQQPESETVPALIEAMRDSDDQVRFNAVLSLARIAPESEEVVSALSGALRDENRYVRAYAAEVLRRVGSAGASEVLLDHLMASRWCPVTSGESLF